MLLRIIEPHTRVDVGSRRYFVSFGVGSVVLGGGWRRWRAMCPLERPELPHRSRRHVQQRLMQYPDARGHGHNRHRMDMERQVWKPRHGDGKHDRRRHHVQALVVHGHALDAVERGHGADAGGPTVPRRVRHGRGKLKQVQHDPVVVVGASLKAHKHRHMAGCDQRNGQTARVHQDAVGFVLGKVLHEKPTQLKCPLWFVRRAFVRTSTISQRTAR
ncbi:hypothetical protein H257_03216 [Aphanomyces astaci]|uniref:Uncharacterized protein n=1 Tax=Aphanomyces astaci TaxID=112090 RepID=W4H1M7_APHAT|nr:hypothetical protein H257_03216 [Aphanomyces astaci]ETV85486.1 hypothetical protein H257_03216 [Aphanomyces astaci]|eukprot:XP_009825504.1 hypothetical protein H257_03216 [Aphanomyces astaci]